MVTLKDLALRVDKSVTTVSRALAGCPDVSKETIRMVREAAKEMGYVPNSIAQRLQKQSSDTIGVVAPVSSKGYAEPFFCEFLAGIGEQAAQFGYDLLVAYAHENNEMNIYSKLVLGRKVDGFILSRTLVDDPRAKYLDSIGFPFAAFGCIDGLQDYPMSKRTVRMLWSLSPTIWFPEDIRELPASARHKPCCIPRSGLRD